MRIAHVTPHIRTDRKSYKSRLDRPGPGWVGIRGYKLRKQATDGIVVSLALPQQAFESADHNSGAGRLEVHALPASSAPDFSLGDVQKMASRRLRHVLPDNWAPPMADVRILLTDKAIARFHTPKHAW